MHLLKASKRYPSLCAKSCLPEGDLASSLARSKWTRVDMFHAALREFELSDQQLWANVPETTAGVTEPFWPCDDAGWELIKDPMSMPSCAVCICSSTLVAFCTAHITHMCELIAVNMRARHLRVELMKPRIRCALGFIMLCNAARDIQIRRLVRW